MSAFAVPSRARTTAGRRLSMALAGMLVASVASILPAAPAAAAPSDAATVVPCSGPSRTATASDLQAFRRAMVDAASGATIRLTDNCTYSFTDSYAATGGLAGWYGASALPAVNKTLTIDGRGAVIQRDDRTVAQFRFFYVGADSAAVSTLGYTSPGAGNLTLKDLTLANGYARGGNGGGSGGGGAGMGGAIYNQGSLQLDRVTIRDSLARGGDGHGMSTGTIGEAGGGGMGPDGLGGGGFSSGFEPAGATGGAGGSDPGGTFDWSEAGSGGGGGGFRKASDNGSNGVAPGAGGAGGSTSARTGMGGVGGGVAIQTAPGGSAGNGSGGGGAAAAHSFGFADGGDGGAGGSFGFGGGHGKVGLNGAFPYSPGGGGGGGGVGGGGGGGGTGADASGSMGQRGGQGGGGGGGGFGGGGGGGGYGGTGGANCCGGPGGSPGQGGDAGDGGVGGFGGGGGGGGRGGDGGKGLSGGAGTSPIADGPQGAGGQGAPGGFGGGDGNDGMNGGPAPSSGGAGGGAGMGGAIFNHGGQLALNNVTMADNQAQGGEGGGTYKGFSGAGTNGRGLGGAVFNLNGSVRLDSSTVAHNQADNGGGLYNLGYSGPDVSPCSTQNCPYVARATLVNSILYYSTAADGPTVSDVVADRPATVTGGATNYARSIVDTDRGTGTNHNIVARTSTGGGGSVVGTPLTVTPGIAWTLAPNVPSSPTPEFTPPATFSVNRDAATDHAAYNAGETSLATDARGVSRTRLGPPDIGAFEWTKNTPTMTVAAQPPTAGLGDKVRAGVTMSGGSQTGGRVTFSLYDIGDTDCSGTPLDTSSGGLAGGEALSDYSDSLTTMGLYRWKASYSGDGENWPVTSACGAATVDVQKATTALSADASPVTASMGDQLTDGARVYKSWFATGTMTFTLFGPSDPTCSGDPVFTSTRPLIGDRADSEAYTVPEQGTYRWVATYNGDDDNKTSSTDCAKPSQSVTVGFKPTLRTTATPSTAGLGDPLVATAKLLDGAGSTGTVTFTAYAPDDLTCTYPRFTSSKPLASDGTATSDPFTPGVSGGYQPLGTYRWKAVFSDGAGVTSVPQACGAVGQTVEVGRSTPTITATASPAKAYGGDGVSDVATLSGVVMSSSLLVTYRLYAEGDATCQTPVATVYGSNQTTTQTADGLVVRSVAAHVPDGTYRWVATYNGSPYDNAVSTPCGAPGQSVTLGGVRTPTVTITGSDPSPATAGFPVRATVQVSGEASTGELNLTLTGPFTSDQACGATGRFNLRPAPQDITGTGSFTSGAVTPMEPGVYYWSVIDRSTAVAYASASESCGPHAKLVVVNPSSGPVAPTRPTILNLPVGPGAGTSFTANVVTSSDGTATVTTSPAANCTVAMDGLTVTFVKPEAPCYLTPHVAGTPRYLASDGDEQRVDIGLTPVTARITNVPDFGVKGETFDAVIASNSDGIKQIYSEDSFICNANHLRVSFNNPGTCRLRVYVYPSGPFGEGIGEWQELPVLSKRPVASSVPTITNLPSPGGVGGSFSPSVSTTGQGQKSVTSGSPDVCRVDGGSVSLLAPGTCSLTAHVGATDGWYAADGTAQTFAVKLVPSAPTIANLPFTALPGGSFVAQVATSSTGVTSVTSSSPATCTAEGLTVTYVAGGWCALVAHVAESADFVAQDGSDQGFLVGFIAPTAPRISNLPASGVIGGSFDATVVTTGNGTRSVTSSTPAICSVSGLTVTYRGAGLCSLTARVAQSATYAAGVGTVQSFTVVKKTLSRPSISNLPSSDELGGDLFIWELDAASTAATDESAWSVTSLTPSVCFVNRRAVFFLDPGDCTLVAHVAETSTSYARDGLPQTVTLSRPVPTEPTISNLPGGGVMGDYYVAAVVTDSNGELFVTSSSPAVCTVASGLWVTYIGSGDCLLTAHVGPGSPWVAADGSPQRIPVTGGTDAPTAPTITNLPDQVLPSDSGFEATVTSSSDGGTTVTSTTPDVCTASGSTVTYVAAGTCTLVPHVAQTAAYAARDGEPASFQVQRRTPTTPTIDNLPVIAPVGGSFVPHVVTTPVSTGDTSFESTTSDVCAVSGLSISFMAAGTCTLVAHVTETADFAAGTSQPLSFLVGQRASVVRIGNLPDSGIVGGSFTAVVFADNPGTRTLSSSDPGVCTVASGLTVTYVGAGTCSLVAHVEATADYLAGDGTAQTFPVTAPARTATTPSISNLPSGAVYGGSFVPTVATTPTSPGSTSVTTSTADVCSVADGTITYVGVGTCTLVAHVAATATYAQGDGASQSFSVGRRTPAAPTITNLPASGVIDGSFIATVSGGARAAKSVTTTSSSVCTVAGLVVTYVGAGTCSLTAHLAQTETDLAADGPAQTFGVGRKTPTGPSISNLTDGGKYGGRFTAVVQSDSDGARSVTSTSTGVCTVSGLVVTYVGVGTCSLTAHVAQSATYAQRDGTAQTFRVDKATATAPTVSLPTGPVVGGSYTPVVSTTGTGARTVTTSSPSVCTVDSTGKVSFVAVGTCSLVAHVAESATHLGNDGTAQSFPVGKGSQTITFATLVDKQFGAAPFAVTATAGSGLPVSFASTTPLVCTVSNATVTLVGGGTCSVTATQSGNAGWLAAAPVTRSFKVTFTSRCMSGIVKLTNILVKKGEALCLDGASTNGGITVQAGGALWVKNSTVKGQILATGAKAVSMCASTLNSVSITASVGPVTIGGVGCGNRFTSVVISKNLGGVLFTDNIATSVVITGNRGGFTYTRNKATKSVVSDNS